MSKFRRAAKVDANQQEIVSLLRSIPGVSVALRHDDILVGHKGKTYWYEIKREGKEKQLKPSQVKLREEWRGHYRVVSSADEIIEDLNPR